LAKKKGLFPARYDDVNIRFVKYIDTIFGTLLTRLLSAPSSGPLLTPGRILIIRPGGIGDAVHLVPVIKALRKTFPETVIDILAEKRNGAVFSLTNDVTNLFRYDTLPGLFSVFRKKYDLVIDTEQWHRLSAVIARLAGAAVIIGYATNERINMFTHPVNYSHDDYEMDSFFNLLTPLHITCRADSVPPFLSVPESARLKTVGLLGDLAAKPFAVLFPGASIKERRWGVQKFIDLAENLQEKGIPSVVIGGSDDSVYGERIAGGGHALNLAGKTSLVETAAVIDQSALLISGDSGILHIGVGLGKPTVSLFGPGIAKKWAPKGSRHFVINKCLPCSPCTRFGYTPKCPIDTKCMSDITADEVFEEVMRLLERQKNK
jgi:ADP-heptose:LPS heptosyltransferase